MFGAKLGGLWYWKVPFREVYCDNLVDLAREAIWCLVINKVFKRDIDALVNSGDLQPITNKE